MASSRPLSASLEDYLETIFHLVQENCVARARDISVRLKVNNSSVTSALQALSKRKLVNYAPYEVITLTAEGSARAKEVIRKHEALKNFFITVLSVQEDEAEESACKMEHVVSRTIVDRLIQFADYVERCPRGSSRWKEGFGYFCETGNLHEGCEICVLDRNDRQETSE